MRNRIFGAIGVLWGGAVLIRSLLRGVPQGSGAYAAGQTGGMIFGGLLLIVGIYYLVKGDKLGLISPVRRGPNLVLAQSTGSYGCTALVSKYISRTCKRCDESRNRS